MVEFLCGDITNLNVDAYVNPINQNMGLNSLNKAIFNKAGYFVRKQVENFKKTKNAEFVEGTISGDLGLKRSSKILHLIKLYCTFLIIFLVLKVLSNILLKVIYCS